MGTLTTTVYCAECDQPGEEVAHRDRFGELRTWFEHLPSDRPPPRHEFVAPDDEDGT